MISIEEKHKMLANEDQESDPFFSQILVTWQKQHGRHLLPWQNTRDAYRIWVSEVMLQQTQVATVIPYYQRFLSCFPDVRSLAAAPLDAVMEQWSGLGYYSRARNLHRCAQHVVTEYSGQFPSDPLLLEKLPGIGRSTAAAIAVFSSGVQAAILDGNVVRVLSRVYGIAESVENKKMKDQFWELAQALLPEKEIESYTQGLMDLGATVCIRSKPACSLCPFQSRCAAFSENRVEELPIRKPKKTIPEKHIAMLVIMDGNRVLLEKRPAFGIWGGLVSLPEWDGTQAGKDESTSSAKLKKQQIADLVMPFGLVASHQRLSSFVHGFTHFKLHVTPYLITLSKRMESAQEPNYVWYELDRMEQAALPAPVKKLLQAIRDDIVNSRISGRIRVVRDAV